MRYRQFYFECLFQKVIYCFFDQRYKMNSSIFIYLGLLAIALVNGASLFEKGKPYYQRNIFLKITLFVYLTVVCDTVEAA